MVPPPAAVVSCDREAPGAQTMRPIEASEAMPPRRWQFGRAAFDERSLTLSIDSRAVEVERKPLELLRHLLHRAGEVVTKDALIRAVWPGRVVTDAALAKSMARLREALEDHDQTLIRTHHGYGYRLIAPLRVELTAPAEHAPLLQTHQAAEAAPPRPGAADRGLRAEHRPLTVLFCDLVGSTQLSESLDPEAFRDLLFDYQRRASDICRRYDGHLAQQLGDGLLMYFGYPAAHDDDAERALRCGCDLVATFSAPDSTSRLSLRIGIHTGPLVIGYNDSSREPIATGTGLHLASRLQGLAEPDTVLVSDATFRLVPGLFVTRDLGPQDIRGYILRVQMHGQSPARSQRLHHHRTEVKPPRYSTRGSHRVRGATGSGWQSNPGVGRDRYQQRDRTHARTVPLYAEGAIREVTAKNGRSGIIPTAR